MSTDLRHALRRFARQPCRPGAASRTDLHARPTRSRGLLGAGEASRLRRKFLLEVTPLDPLADASAVLLLAGVAAAACYLPVRRATQVKPMAVLRAE